MRNFVCYGPLDDDDNQKHEDPPPFSFFHGPEDDIGPDGPDGEGGV